MNLRDLEYLVAVADFHHFRKAADFCHVSQPTLSGQLKKLEDEKYCSLFTQSALFILYWTNSSNVYNKYFTLQLC